MTVHNIAKKAPAGFAQTIAGAIRAVVAQEHKADPRPLGLAAAHRSNLSGTASYVAGLGDDDPAVVALWFASAALGSSHGYAPGPKQLGVLQTVGTELGASPSEQPLPGQVLAWLVSVALEETRERLHRPAVTATAERDRALNQLRRLQDRSVDRAELEIERQMRDHDKALIDQLGQEIRRLQGLLSMAGDPLALVDEPELEEEPQEESGKALEFVRTGVFIRHQPTGDTFGCVYPDRESGKGRKKQGFGSEEAAAAFRERMVRDREAFVTGDRQEDAGRPTGTAPDLSDFDPLETSNHEVG